MNRPGPEHDPVDPLQLARQLEGAPCGPDGPVGAGCDPSKPGANASGEGHDTFEPQDYQAALAGLALIRRAVQQERDASRSGITAPSPSQSRADSASQVTVPPETAGDLRDTTRAAEASQAPADSRSERARLAEETNRLGRFEILRELGRGGFGVVLLARDPQLDRLVALKVPRADALVDRDARQRFDREARLSSLLSHPNIVPIYESGAVGPVAYIASGYCQGQSLASWFAERGRVISPELAARIALQLAQAVQYAHQRGVLHRDLKPSNILLDLASEGPPTDESIVAALRITDFGLARSLTQAEEGLTRAGAIVGTPAYMAPEQAGGESTHVGAAADIYALGVIFYELLTGGPPFQKGTELATLRAVESERPPPPHQLRPGLAVDLEAIVLKCLEKAPQQRYSTAYDLQFDLEQFLQGRPVRARRVTRLEHAWRWCRRNPALAAALACVLLGAVAATSQWWRAERNWSQAREFLAQAESQRARAERNLTRSEVAIDQLLSEVAIALKNIPRMESLRNRLLQQALELQQALVRDQADDVRVRFRTAQAQRRIAEITLVLGQWDKSLAATQAAEAELQRIAAEPTAAVDAVELDREQGRIQAIRSELSRQLGQIEAARDAAQHAVQSWQRVLDASGSVARSEDLGELARAFRQTGMACELSQEFSAAAEHYRAGLALIDGSDPAARPDELELERGFLLNSLGVLHGKTDQPDQAETYYRQSIEVIEPIVARRPDRVDLGYHLAITALNLGNRYSRLRDHAEAIPFYEQARGILEGLIQSFPENTAYRRNAIRAASGLGLSQFRTGDAATALETMNRALAAQVQLPANLQGTNDFLEERAILFSNLGNVYLQGLHDDEAALQSYQRGIEIREQLVQENSESANAWRGLSVAQGNAAAVWVQQRNLTLARAAFEKAWANAELACRLAPRDAACQANAAFQIEQLCQIGLRQNTIETLLAQLQQYAAGAADSGLRNLQAAKILAGGLLAIDRGLEAPDESGGDLIDLQIQAEDLEQLRTAARDYLRQAVQKGAIQSESIRNSAEWSAVLGDMSLDSFLESN